jgi:hypothetical protein
MQDICRNTELAVVYGMGWFDPNHTCRGDYTGMKPKTLHIPITKNPLETEGIKH